MTIGNTVYNSNGALEISASKDSSSVINGTISVTGEQVGVKVTGDTDGVNVTFANGAINSITGLNVGGSVTFNNKIFTRNENYLFDGVIDITKAKVGNYHTSLTIAKAFKDGTQIAEC